MAKTGKTKSGDDQTRAALLEMSVKLLHAIEGLRHALSVPLEPKVASAPKPPAKRKGRPPMTEEQRAAARAARGVLTSTDIAMINDAAPKPAKPQPVTRASLAAQNAAPAETSYFTKQD